MLLTVVSHKYTQGRKSGDDSAEVSSIANTLPLLMKGPVEPDPVSEWLHLLVHLLTCRGKLLDVFRLVGPKRSHEDHASVWEGGPKVNLLSVAVADEETGPYQKRTQCSSFGHGISHEQVIFLSPFCFLVKSNHRSNLVSCERHTTTWSLVFKLFASVRHKSIDYLLHYYIFVGNCSPTWTRCARRP